MKLRFARTLAFLLSSAIFLSSCQKEAGFTDDLDPNGNGGGPPVTTDIKGNWKFIGLNAATNVSISVTESGQSVRSEAISDYTSQNNGGRLTITDSKFIFTGITYSVSDEVTAKMYLNNVLVDEFSEPFEEEIAPTDSEANYVRVNNDSLTFTDQVSVIPDPSGGVTPGPATSTTGARISLSGNILTVKINVNSTSTIDQGGTPATFGVKLISEMKFERE